MEYDGMIVAHLLRRAADAGVSMTHDDGALQLQSQHTVLTAATASKAWREADAAYTNHLMSCRACHAATGRYCVAGVDLRQRYNSTPMEVSE